MKYLKIFLSAIAFLSLSFHLEAQSCHGTNKAEKKTETTTQQSLDDAKEETVVSFRVYGNCGMCKRRMETAALSLDGVRSADWDDETGMMTVRYTGDQVDSEAVQKAIAKVGHDTEKFRAEDAVYAALHTCCQYERAK